MAYKSIDEKRKYNREWAAKRRANFFSNQDCERCQSKENLTIHHLDKKKKLSHNIWSWSLTRRVNELIKCIVLCDNCHRIEHGKYREGEWHGSATGYGKYKCRCDICREWKIKSRIPREVA